MFGILKENNPELTGEKRRTIVKPPQVPNLPYTNWKSCFAVNSCTQALWATLPSAELVQLCLDPVYRLKLLGCSDLSAEHKLPRFLLCALLCLLQLGHASKVAGRGAQRSIMGQQDPHAPPCSVVHCSQCPYQPQPPSYQPQLASGMQTCGTGAMRPQAVVTFNLRPAWPERHIHSSADLASLAETADTSTSAREPATLTDRIALCPNLHA